MKCSEDRIKQATEWNRANKQCLAYSNMSWVNHGEWHIDHIRPLCSFDLTNEHDLLECCHIKNLQPLWAHDNQTKSNEYETN